MTRLRKSSIERKSKCTNNRLLITSAGGVASVFHHSNIVHLFGFAAVCFALFRSDVVHTVRLLRVVSHVVGPRRVRPVEAGVSTSARVG